MSDSAQLAHGRPTAARSARALRRFPATVGRFDEADSQATMDSLADWVETHFHDDLQRRPSKHVYVRLLPEPIVGSIDRLRDSEVILGEIRRHFDADWAITPMKHTDELYISHYNKDYGGDQGLYSKHYDGNMRFLPFGAVVRALIYLQSDATYTVVFGDSQVRKNFRTYDFGLLDFHRELHWVEGEYNPSDQQRILLKCNYLIAPPNAGWLAVVVERANTAVFYVVKAAMEYSKSPRNPSQVAVGIICNVVRELNNVHPLIPLALLGAGLTAVVWSAVALAF